MQIVFLAAILLAVICPVRVFSSNDNGDLKNVIVEYRKTLEAPAVEQVPWEQKRGPLDKFRLFVAGLFERKDVEKAKILEAESKTHTQLALTYIAIAENLLSSGKKNAAEGYIDGAGKLLQMRNDSHHAALETYAGHLGKALELEERTAKISADVGIYSFKIANMLGGNNKAVKYFLSIAGATLDTAIAGTYKGSDAAIEEAKNAVIKLALERFLFETKGKNIPLAELIKDPKTFSEIIAKVTLYLASEGTKDIIKDGLVPVFEQRLADVGKSLPKIEEFAAYDSKLAEIAKLKEKEKEKEREREREREKEEKAGDGNDYQDFFDAEKFVLPPPPSVNPSKDVEPPLIPPPPPTIPSIEIVLEACEVSGSSPDCY